MEPPITDTAKTRPGTFPNINKYLNNDQAELNKNQYGPEMNQNRSFEKRIVSANCAAFIGLMQRVVSGH